jgi:sporulation protein YlmC with PRC-barrel domain
MVKAFFASVLLLAATCARTVPAQTNEFVSPLKAGQLIGLQVEDTDGRKVGTLRNLILDVRTGRVRYAVIASGGFIGIRPILRLAPAQMMSAATTKRETLSLNTTMGQWKGAPAFKPSQLSSLAEHSQAEQITRYFAKTDARLANASGPSLATTGGGAGSQTNASPDSLKFASDMIGKTVVNRRHQKIGEVVDLMVGFSQTHSAFAIVSTGKFIWRGHEYAVPVILLSPVSSGGRLMVDADASVLQQAPPFTQQVWDGDAAEKAAVFTYSKKEQ